MATRVSALVVFSCNAGGVRQRPESRDLSPANHRTQKMSLPELDLAQ
jgi:hypothetical protein